MSESLTHTTPLTGSVAEQVAIGWAWVEACRLAGVREDPPSHALATATDREFQWRRIEEMLARSGHVLFRLGGSTMIEPSTPPTDLATE